MLAIRIRRSLNGKSRARYNLCRLGLKASDYSVRLNRKRKHLFGHYPTLTLTEVNILLKIAPALCCLLSCKAVAQEKFTSSPVSRNLDTGKTRSFQNCAHDGDYVNVSLSKGAKDQFLLC